LPRAQECVRTLTEGSTDIVSRKTLKILPAYHIGAALISATILQLCVSRATFGTPDIRPANFSHQAATRFLVRVQRRCLSPCIPSRRSRDFRAVASRMQLIANKSRVWHARFGHCLTSLVVMAAPVLVNHPPRHERTQCSAIHSSRAEAVTSIDAQPGALKQARRAGSELMLTLRLVRIGNRGAHDAGSCHRPTADLEQSVVTLSLKL
jgi:hypothetical protein